MKRDGGDVEGMMMMMVMVFVVVLVVVQHFAFEVM